MRHTWVGRVGIGTLVGVMVLLVAGPLARVASADDDTAFDAANTVAKFDRALRDVRPEVSRIDANLSTKICTDAVARARAAGDTRLVHSDFDQLGGVVSKESNTKYEITLDRAATLCAEYAPYYAVGKHAGLFRSLGQRMEMLTTDDAPSAEFVKGVLEQADACTKAVAEITDGGVPATFAFTMQSTPYTVAELNPKLCDAVPKAAAKYTKDAAAGNKKNEERFTKVGISGDKLALMIKYNGGVYLPGGAEDPTFKNYASASALFVWLTGNEDADGYVVHTIRKYQFSGNKLTAKSEKTYRMRKGAKVGDVFR